MNLITVILITRCELNTLDIFQQFPEFSDQLKTFCNSLIVSYSLKTEKISTM